MAGFLGTIRNARRRFAREATSGAPARAADGHGAQPDIGATREAANAAEGPAPAVAPQSPPPPPSPLPPRAKWEGEEVETIIALVYRRYLNREPDERGRANFRRKLMDGLSLADFIDHVANSEEAKRKRAAPAAPPKVAPAVPPRAKWEGEELDAIIALVYRHHLNREPDERGRTNFRRKLTSGLSLPDFIDHVANSEEARRKRAAPAVAPKVAPPRAKWEGEELDAIIALVYRHHLNREPDERGRANFRRKLTSGLSLPDFIDHVASSEEARRRTQGGDTTDTDAQFLLNIGEALIEGNAARPRRLEGLKLWLREDRSRRRLLVDHLVGEYLKARRADGGATPAYGENQWAMMGTSRLLSKALWDRRVAELDLAAEAPVPPPALNERQFRHSGSYRVSIITSLYRGRAFLETFLENMVSQTIFAACELIIIDADSPEGEGEVIRRYMKVYPNIVYRRMDYRIGIYDAWNVGVQMARGAYVTNCNLDDLRRVDSLELQAAALDRHAFADVVYQDFFYSLDPSLSFDQVARCGFRSDLPHVTVNGLFEYNPPHNAPMWRKRLHDEVGYFDTLFRSAGDYEFWMRCVQSGKTFLKLNTPHVAYFLNPEGISTSPESRSAIESRQVWSRYAKSLPSPYLLMSRADFAGAIGDEPESDWSLSSYDLVQRRLRALGDEAKSAAPDGIPADLSPSGGEAGIGRGSL